MFEIYLGWNLEMLIAWTFLLVLVFVLLGASLSPQRFLLETEVSSRGNSRYSNQMLLPAIGGLSVGILCYLLLLAFKSSSHMLGLVLIGVLCAIGLWRLRLYFKTPTRALVPLASLAGLSLFICLPFAFYLAPPDVDAGTYGYYAFLIKTSSGFPTIHPWGEVFSMKHLIPPAAYENLVALFSIASKVSLSQSLMIVVMSFVISAVLVGWDLAKKVLEAMDAPTSLAPFCIPFVLNGAFLWEYGDGSYNRTPATVGILLCAAFATRFMVTKNSRLLVAMGFFHGAILYFHYRFFIWNSTFLGVWLVFLLFRRESKWQKILFLPAISFFTVLPLLLSKLSVLVRISKRETVGDMIAAKHELTLTQVCADLFRFQGYVSIALIVAAGIGVFVVKKRAQKIPHVVSYGLFSLAAMAFFSIDSLVLSVLPFTKNFLYSQVAVIYNHSLSKLAIGSFIAALLYKSINASHSSDSRFLQPKLLFTVLIYAATLLSFSIVAYLMVRDFSAVPPIIYLHINFFYCGALLMAAVIAGFIAFRSSTIASQSVTIVTALLLIYGANEFRIGRINYPYITAGDNEVFFWLRNNTTFEDTIVLSHSMHDIPEESESKNWPLPAERVRSNFMTYSYYWLPVLSERRSFFNRGNFMRRLLGSELNLNGSDPELAALDQAYFNLDNPTSCEVFHRNRVTHLFFESGLHSMFTENLNRSPCLTLVFESTDRSGIDPRKIESSPRGAAVYKVM